MNLSTNSSILTNLYLQLLQANGSLQPPPRILALSLYPLALAMGAGGGRKRAERRTAEGSFGSCVGVARCGQETEYQHMLRSLKSTPPSTVLVERPSDFQQLVQEMWLFWRRGGGRVSSEAYQAEGQRVEEWK